MRTHLWTWGGKYFGYRDGNDLWTPSGRHVGRFTGDEVYGPDGRYLGEIKSGKLISRLASQNRRRGGFAPHGSHAGQARYVNHAGTAMYAGYQDFPAPDSFK
jgi:hypothetical protein